jgi:hypothetical protein
MASHPTSTHSAENPWLNNVASISSCNCSAQAWQFALKAISDLSCMSIRQLPDSNSIKTVRFLRDLSGFKIRSTCPGTPTQATMAWTSIFAVAACTSHCSSSSKQLFKQITHLIHHIRTFTLKHLHKRPTRTFSPESLLLFTAHTLALTRTILNISHQLRGSKQSRTNANHKLLLLPPIVRTAILMTALEKQNQTTPTNIKQAQSQLCIWFTMQAAISIKPIATTLVTVYAILGRKATYVGITHNSRDKALGPPIMRGFEHLKDIFHDNYTTTPGKKAKAFRYELQAQFSQHVIAILPEDQARHVEKQTINQLQTNANTTFSHINKKTHFTARKRQPKQFRNNNNLTDTITPQHHHLINYQQTQLSRTKQTIFDTQLALRQSFNNVYRLRQQHTNITGPLSPFLDEALFVSWIARTRKFESWHELGTIHQPITLLKATRWLKHIPSYHRRQIATYRLNYALRMCQQPPLRRFFVRIDPHVPLQRVRHCFKTILNSHCSSNIISKLRCKLALQSVCFVHGAPLNFKTMINQAKTARSFQRAQLLHWYDDPDSTHEAWSGQQFHRYKLYFKTALPPMFPKYFEDTINQLIPICKYARAPTSAIEHIAHSLATICNQLQSQCQPPMPQTTQYMQQIMDAQNSETLAVEDKDPSSAWGMPSDEYAKCLIHLMRLDQEKWIPLRQTTAVSAQQQKLNIYNAATKAGYGPKKGGYLKKSDQHNITLPYIYGTVKAKCYHFAENSHSTTHICQKHQHSCFRRIVSSARLEPAWRKHLKIVSRATQLLINKFMPGFEVESLDTSAHQLATQLRRLKQPRTPQLTCHDCGQPKAPIELSVADAGAMYEQCSVEWILAAVQGAVDIATSRGFQGMVVLRGPKMIGWPSRHLTPRKVPSTIVDWPTLLAMHHMTLTNKIALLGDLPFKQLQGLPIGGLMSKCQTSALLGSQETIWKKTLTQQQTLPNMITCRYVDDSITVSPTLCHTCQHQHLTNMTNVSFDKQNFLPTQVQWLDITITTRGSQLTIQPTAPEPSFTQGTTNTPTKFRVPPYNGQMPHDIKTRIQAWQHRTTTITKANMILNNGQCGWTRQHVHSWMSLWRAHGYPPSELQKAFNRYVTCPSLAKHVKTWQQT